MEPRTRRRKDSSILLTRMQCANCKMHLACDFDRRRDVMICPQCNHKAALVYVPPNEPYIIPLDDMPLALSPKQRKSLLKGAVKTLAAAAVGFAVCVTVYALDYGAPINQWAKNRVQDLRGYLGMPPAPVKRSANESTGAWDRLFGYFGWGPAAKDKEAANAGPTGYTTEDWGTPSSQPTDYSVGPGKVRLPIFPEHLRPRESANQPAEQPARPEPRLVRYRFMVLDRENGQLIASRVHIVADSLEAAKRTISQLATQEGFAVIEDPDGDVPNPDTYNRNNPLTQSRPAPTKGMTEIVTGRPPRKPIVREGTTLDPHNVEIDGKLYPIGKNGEVIGAPRPSRDQERF